MLNLSQVRIIDPVLTRVSHGFTNPVQGVADFIAPRVPVPTRAGKIIKFGKEQFAITNTKRSPATNIRRMFPNYSLDNYSTEQDALGAEIPFEHLEEAAAGSAGIAMNLQMLALNSALASLDLNWENEVLSLVNNPAKFETGLTSVPATKFDATGSDALSVILAAKEAVRAQSAVYPNSMVIGPRVYSALQRQSSIQETIKYQGRFAANLDDLAVYFGLSRGVRVSEKVKLDANGNLVDLMGDNVLLFYAPEGNAGITSNGVPSFAYTYALQGYPIVTPFRADLDRRVMVADAIREQSVIITGMGATGKAGAAYLLTDTLTT